MQVFNIGGAKKKSVWTSVDAEPSQLFGKERSLTSSLPQREIFSASLTDPDASRAYNHSISIFFEGALDVDSLYSSLLNLIQRHEALRGSFSADGEKFVVREGIAFALPVLDLSPLGPNDQKEEYDRFVRRELDHVFDLVRGPLFRSTLVRYSPEKWTLIFNCHHVVVDGWSLKTILDDLPKLYSTLVAGDDGRDFEPSSSFTEYLSTVVAHESGAATSVRDFWKKTFEDGVPVLDLPLDKPRPRYRTYNSRREDYKVDRKIYEKLKAEGAKNGSSQFITLLAAFSLYLYRISGQNDHIVGVPAAGQIKSGKAKLLGHDARLLPIRCIIGTDDTFKSFSRRLMDTFFAAYENQLVSFPRLIQDLNVPQDPSRVPFVAVMFNFDPGVKAEEFQFKGLKSSFFFNHRNFETFEISINAVVEHDDLVLECAYNSELFEDSEMHERLVQLEALMSSIVEQPDWSVSRLGVLTAKQLQEMDSALNSTAMTYEQGVTVDELVERIARKSPDRIAVEYKNSQLSYAQLWERSGKVARAILDLNLGPAPLVGVMVDRSEAMVEVLLGIWRAGGAFVPLDPSYPLDRLQYMVEHSEIKVVLADKNHVGSLSMPNVKYLVASDIQASAAAPFSGKIRTRSPDDIAYVIYTSGSTGKPKGVKVPQRCLNNFLTAMQTQAPGISAEDRLLAVTTLSFDIAELELWLPLITGARVVIADRATAIDGLALMKEIREKKITFLQATPATWRLLIISGWEGDKRITALCGGEALPRELADDLLKRVGALWNMYGPTETTVWSTLDRVKDGAITIGRPIGNTQAYVLDAHNKWVPRGVVGELWLGGDGVTQGYLGRDDLTAERFLPNPFTGRGRMYKTGDLVRIRMDGRIEYVGRNDFQVKVRGFRIELGEVQHALSQNPAIQACVVVVKEKSPGDAHLVAYYSLKPGAQAKISELKASMKGLVPDYMLPSIFMELAELPLTQNGKINVKALPVAFGQTAQEDDFAAPVTEQEIYLARLWGELLGVNRVGRHDRFLEVGGHSLLAIRAIQAIQKDRGVQIAPKSMILKNLAQLARELTGEADGEPAEEAQQPAATTTGERTFFFGETGAKKLGHYYEGRAEADFAVLICGPIGQEYMRTHWMIRNMASQLNRKGVAVMRFDFFGQGDSEGRPEEIRLEALRKSVLDAAGELRARSGAKKIKLIALRASSLLAHSVREKLGSSVELLFVDPVSSGRDYLRELRGVRDNYWRGGVFFRRSRKVLISDSESEEILGQLYSREFLRELEALPGGEASRKFVIAPSPGWSDRMKLENVFLSHALLIELQAALFGAEP